MKIITGGRQTGRTTKLIELAAEAEARGEVCYIVCHSAVEARRIAIKARHMELSIGYPITYAEFVNVRYAGARVHHVYIDNVEMLLQHISTFPIAAVTITTDE